MLFQEKRKDVIRKAKSLFDGGRMTEARDILEQGLRDDENDVRINNFLAYLYYKMGDFGHARETYRRLAKIEPENVAIWSNLGLLAYKMGLYEEARQAFEEYLRLKPGDAKIISYLSLVLEKMGKSSAAREYFAMARNEETVTAAAGAADAQDARHESAQAPPGVESAMAEASGGEEEVDLTAAPPPAPAAYEEPPPVLEIAFAQAVDPGEGEVGRFRIVSRRLTAIRLESRVLFTLPSLALYRGAIVFQDTASPFRSVPRKYRHDALLFQTAEGTGDLWLTHEEGGLTLLDVMGGPVVINAHRLVALDAGLTVTHEPVGKDGFVFGLAALRVEGRGQVVVAAGEEPLRLSVEPGTPLHIKPWLTVAWSGQCNADLPSGDEFRKAKYLSSEDYLRLEGEGTLILSGGFDHGL